MGPLLQTATQPSYGLALLQALTALAAVAALAWFSLRWAARRGLGQRQGQLVQVVERVALDHQTAVSVVRVGQRAWLVGHGDGSAPRTLAELEPSLLRAEDTPDTP